MSKTILIADDLKDVRDILKMAVSSDYPNLFEADSGNQAIRILGEQYIDLVILDFSMPNGNGLDVLRSSSSFKNPDVKFIVLSDYCQNIEGDPMIKNVEAVIDKPFSGTSLLEVIKRALNE